MKEASLASSTVPFFGHSSGAARRAGGQPASKCRAATSIPLDFVPAAQLAAVSPEAHSSWRAWAIRGPTVGPVATCWPFLRGARMSEEGAKIGLRTGSRSAAREERPQLCAWQCVGRACKAQDARAACFARWLCAALLLCFSAQTRAQSKQTNTSRAYSIVQYCRCTGDCVAESVLHFGNPICSRCSQIGLHWLADVSTRRHARASFRRAKVSTCLFAPL